MKSYLQAIKSHIEAHPPNFGDGESVLTMLYECYNENNPYDNEQIRADFNELYRQMTGMPPAGDGQHCLPDLQTLPGSRKGWFH